MGTMIKDIYEYFEKLEDQKLERQGTCLVFDDDNIREADYNYPDYRPISIHQVYYYIKSTFGVHSLSEVATNKMYNSIGMPTPPTYVLKKFRRPGDLEEIDYVINPDIKTIPDYDFVVCKKAFGNTNIVKFINNYDKWDIFSKHQIKDFFLEYMTPECLQQLISLCLIDELRTEKDRHFSNLFLYKKKGAEKYEGIIPIDNEYTHLHDIGANTSDDFSYFVQLPYSCANPLSRYNESRSYRDRQKSMRDLIQKGLISSQQIELIKRELEFDLPSNIQNAGISSLELDCLRTSAYTSTQRLWDYNRQNIGQDLGL